MMIVGRIQNEMKQQRKENVIILIPPNRLSKDRGLAITVLAA